MLNVPRTNRLESLRKHARRRLGLDLVEPSKPNLSNDDDYWITPATTAQKPTASSDARAKATEIQKSKVITLSKLYFVRHCFISLYI